MVQSATPSRSSWRFSVSVLVPVLVAVLVAIGTATGFVLWSTTRSDDRALDRQTRLVSHILGKERQYISDEQSAVSPSDEAIDALEGGIDIDWVSDVLGAAFYDDFGPHRIYLLDPDLRPVFAMRDGGDAARSSFQPDSQTILGLARQLRTDAALSAISAYENGFGDVPAVADFAIIEGKPALVGVIPMLGESEDVLVPPGKAFTHVAIRFLDDALAGELMENYLIDGAHFGADASVASGEAALPLRDAAGNTVAWFKWLPDRPGAQILSETAPAMVLALLAAGLVVVLLLLRLRKSSSELEAARAEAHHRALHDPLTGLANRAGFQDRLAQALSALARGRAPVALLALDLDRFKQVNDTLGHDAGDQLLRQVAKRLQPLVRDTDTVARLGGDEFAIIQTDLRTPADTESLSRRIIDRVAEPYALLGGEARIGVSIGIAIAGTPSEAADLPARADFALYEAKENGRNAYRIFGTASAADPVDLPAPANTNRVA